jgi:hypothetical protein
MAKLELGRDKTHDEATRPKNQMKINLAFLYNTTVNAHHYATSLLSHSLYYVTFDRSKQKTFS